MNHAGGAYVRNTSCWLADLVAKLTCISPWNSNGGQNQAGTLVSPRHLVMAEHYQFGVGTKVRYITADNQVVERTVTAVQSVGPSNSQDYYATDITVALLDSDVPPSISPAKVLPNNWLSYLPSLTTVTGVPAIATNQYKQVLVSDFISTQTGIAPTNAQRLLFFRTIISGDSGSPAFLVVNNELVLLTTWTWGGGGGGPNYANLLASINAVMTSLGGSYQLTPADLSGFPTY
jgi:hypothetical protein